MENNDSNTNIINKLENDIHNIIYNDNKSTTHYDYHFNNNKTKYYLKIYTYNPRHNTTFLFLTEETDIDDNILSSTDNLDNNLGDIKIKLLKTALWHVKRIKPPKYNLNYTIQWKKKHEDEYFVSHFSGNTIKQIIDKFYDGKNYHDYIIYSAKLNPTC